MGIDAETDKAVAAEIPSWIDARLFVDALKEVELQFKDIEDFKLKHALAPGENYASIMLNVDIVIRLKDKSSKTVSFMLKVGHDTELFRQMIQNHNIFTVEAGMYWDVIPEMEKIFFDAGVNVKFGAKSYSLPTNQPYILLENLKTKGFCNANRLEGLDMRHVKSVLKKLAQWHAASAVRVATKGRYADIYAMGYLRSNSYDIIKEMFENTTKALLACVKDYSNCDMYYEKIARMQHRVTDDIFKTRANADDYDNEEFMVLNHGDAWLNNIMFQYDDETGNILETYFVDYQLPCYSTPAQDLLYFIMTSCQYEIKLKEFDYMIAFYHRNLEESLRLLSYSKKIPSLKDIHCMLFNYGIWGYSAAINVMAIVLCDPTNNANLDNFISETEDGLAFKKKMYSNPRYRKHMEAILPWLLNRGILDS